MSKRKSSSEELANALDQTDGVVILGFTIILFVGLVALILGAIWIAYRIANPS